MKRSAHWQSSLTATLVAAVLAFLPIFGCAMLQWPAFSSENSPGPLYSIQGNVRQIPGSNEFIIELGCR